MKLDETYSTKEAAAYLGVPVRTMKFYLYDVPEALRLKPDKTVGRAFLFTQKTLDDFKAKYAANKRPEGRPITPGRPLTRKRGKLREPEIQALSLLSMENIPLDSDHAAALDLLVLRKMAVRDEKCYRITEKGCDWVAQHLVGSSRPNPKLPCGFLWDK